MNQAGDCWLWTAACNNMGYGVFRVDGKLRLAHRVAWGLQNGGLSAIDGLELDHRLECPKSCVNPAHLRVTTHKQNLENRVLPSNNTSGARGVTWDKRKNRWKAAVYTGGRCIHVGYFDDVEEAAARAAAKRREVFTHNDADWR